MFIGGLSWQTTPESIREYFSTFGELAEVMVMKDPATRRSRGFGFVTFTDHLAVDKVLKCPVHQVNQWFPTTAPATKPLVIHSATKETIKNEHSLMMSCREGESVTHFSGTTVGAWILNTNIKRFEVRISNGSVLEWSIIAIATAMVLTYGPDHSKTKLLEIWTKWRTWFWAKWLPFKVSDMNTLEIVNNSFYMFSTFTIFEWQSEGVPVAWHY